MTPSEASTFRQAAHQVRCALLLEDDQEIGKDEADAALASSTSSTSQQDEVVARLQEQHAETVTNLLAAHASKVKSLRAMVDGLRRAASTQQEQHGGLAPFAVAAANATTTISATTSMDPATSSAPKVGYRICARSIIQRTFIQRIYVC